MKKEGKSFTFLIAGCREWKPPVVMLAVYFVLACLALLFKKVLEEGESNLVIVTYRFATSAIFLMPIAYFYERRRGPDVKLTRSVLCYICFNALIGMTLSQYLYLLGIQYTSAAFSTAFSNFTPVVTFLFALILRQESVNLKSKGGRAKLLGSLICIGGVLLLIFYRGIPLTQMGNSSYYANNTSVVTKVGSEKNWILGSIFLVLSILCWSCWFILQSRIGKKYPCKYMSTALMSAFGAVESAILCFSINRSFSVWILKGKLQIITVLSAGVFGSGLCYVGMSWCVEQKGAVFTSAFIPFIEIYITILDLTFFHEQIYLGSVIGSILVISGLYVVLWGKSSDASSSITKQAEIAHDNGSSAIDMTRATNSGCPS